MKQVVKEKQDMRHLSWAKIRHSSGTAGSFLKSYSELGGRKVYYKLSNFDPMRGVVGHECVNEIIVDRLLTVLGVEHLSYQLIRGEIVVGDQVYESYLCASEDFKKPGESKIALDVFYELERQDGEQALEFCVRQGWGESIYKMLVADFLILNRDRHGANIEVLRDKRSKRIRLAPFFDHGLSLMFNCLSEESIEEFDVMQDKPTNNYIGTRSTWENLKLIPVDQQGLVHPLKESDREVLFADLEDVMSPRLREKIWDMIWKRWCAYEDFCHSRRA